jgi:hypothetical protein
MNLNPIPTLDSQPPTQEHKEAPAAEAREAESASLTAPVPATADAEPSRSERLYEAYRLWAFTGR